MLAMNDKVIDCSWRAFDEELFTAKIWKEPIVHATCSEVKINVMLRLCLKWYNKPLSLL